MPTARGYVEAVDGRPSAPESDPEPPELTERNSRPASAERELVELRTRAYGADADIDDDPAAVARLVELEAAHVVAHEASSAVVAPAAAPLAEATVAADPSAEPMRATPHVASRPRHRGAWPIAAAILTAVVVLAAIAWYLAPHPDATLHQTEVQADSAIIDVLSAQGRGPDASTLRQFETYHEVGVWSVENAAGRVCFVVWDIGGSGRFSIKCAPPAREVALSLTVEPEDGDGFGRWLPEGSVVSFHFRENTVDVFVRPPAD